MVSYTLNFRWIQSRLPDPVSSSLTTVYDRITAVYAPTRVLYSLGLLAWPMQEVYIIRCFTVDDVLRLETWKSYRPRRGEGEGCPSRRDAAWSTLEIHCELRLHPPLRRLAARALRLVHPVYRAGRVGSCVALADTYIPRERTVTARARP